MKDLKPNEFVAKPVQINMPKAVEKDKRVKQTDVFGKDVETKKKVVKRKSVKKTTKPLKASDPQYHYSNFV